MLIVSVNWRFNYTNTKSTDSAEVKSPISRAPLRNIYSLSMFSLVGQATRNICYRRHGSKVESLPGRKKPFSHLMCTFLICLGSEMHLEPVSLKSGSPLLPVIDV